MVGLSCRTSYSVRSRGTSFPISVRNGSNGPYLMETGYRVNRSLCRARQQGMSTATASPSTTGPPPFRVPPQPPQRPQGLSGHSRSERRWWRRLPLVSGITAVAIVAALFIDLEPLSVLLVLFVLVVPFEKLYPRHRGQRLRRPEVGTDVAFALLTPLLTPLGGIVAVIIGLVSLAWIPGLLVRPLLAQLPASVTPYLGVVLFDLAIYWIHRWSHEVPLLWRFHAVHHSTDKLDWVSGFRNHPVDGALIAPPFAFLIAAGFDPEFSGVLVVVQIVTGLFLHANARFLLRPLHRIVITPEFHHWHHANEPDAINHNYSVFLPAWDLLFGTYFMPRNRRPQVYGITEFMPRGVVSQLRYPFRGMGNPLPLLWFGLRHPLRATRRLARATRPVLVDVWHSTRRQTRTASLD